MLTHEQQCDALIQRLNNAAALLAAVKTGDADAARKLSRMCDHQPHTGDVLCLNCDAVIGYVLEPETVEIPA